MSDCPGTERLDALISGRLAQEELAAIEAHVDTCADCQTVLDQLSAFEMSIVDVVEKLTHPQATVGNWNEHRADRLADAVREAQWELPAGHSSAVDAELPVIPGHRILHVIGQGGMGTVYRGVQLDLNREVAVKVLDARQASDVQQLTKRFSHEAQVTANLDHPSIVPVHAIGRETAGRCFYTMRLVRGRELKDVLPLADRGAEGWSRSRVIGVLIRVCQTLAFAHARGIVHRDLKPSNVMVGELGEVYVLDWGLARAADRAEVRDLRLDIDTFEHSQATSATVASCDALGSTIDMCFDESKSRIREPNPSSGESSAPDAEDSANRPLLTIDGAVIGTPTYMPPEQAAGKLKQIDQRSDVYALGTLLYQTLTGTAPYICGNKKASSIEILRAVIAGPPESIQTLAPAAPPELIAICEKAMARERDQRYASALELAEELEAFLERRVVKAYQTGAIAEAKKWVVRNRGVAVSAALAFLAAIAGLSITLVLQDRANRELTNANQEKHEALNEQLRISGELLEKSQQLTNANDELETKNVQLVAAFKAESDAKESERVAKLRAMALLAESYANFGEQEAVAGQYARAALWFTNAADLSAEQPDIQHTHRMRAMQYRRAAPVPVAAWWDNDKLQELGWFEWPQTSRLYFNPTDQYLLWRGGSHPNQRFTAHWLKNRILDLHNTDRPLWSNAIYDAAAFSPDGLHAAVSPKAGQVSIHRLSDEKQIDSLPLGENAQTISILDYSHDGQRLYAGTSPARVWDVAQARFLKGQYTTGNKIVDVGFSQDDRQFLTIAQNNELRLFEIKDEDGTHKPIQTTKDDPELLAKFTFRQRRGNAQQQPNGTEIDARWLGGFGGPDERFVGSTFESTGRLMAKAHNNGVIRLWQVNSPKPYWYIRTNGWARPVFSEDSSLVAAVGHYYVTWRDGLPASEQKQELLSTQVYDPATGQPVGPELKAGAAILSGCFSPDGKTFVLACGAAERSKDTVLLADGKGGAIQFWDWKAGTPIGDPLPTPSEPQAIAWHPQRNFVAVGCAAGEVLKIDVAARKATQIFDGKMNSNPTRYLPGDFCDCGVAFDATGSLLMWWGFGAEKHVLEFDTGKIRYTPDTKDWCTGMAMHGDVMLVNNPHGTGPASVRNWRQDKWLFSAGSSPSRLSRDGRFVASTGRQRSTVVWEVATRKVSCQEIHSSGTDVGFVEGTPFLITTGGFRSSPCWIEFWDYRLGRMAAPRLEIPTSRFTGFIRVSADGRFAAMSCQPYGLLVLDLHSFHDDPLQGLSAEHALMLSEIQTSEQIQGGRMVRQTVDPGKPVMVHHWLNRWQEFNRRNPEFLRRDVPRSLAIRDHQTRAAEFEMLENAAAADFHRRMANQLIVKSETAKLDPAIAELEPAATADAVEDRLDNQE